ncbi:DNA topoisomerase 3 [bacterium]|jgi:DNA topoisomerase III|nr:DNA topoisomerase 3 [bacterium]MBT3581562.1 DNA topoisomerase 3 [bacterium]MBT4551473.1 DNA topoisomerase 3 [bacterium]MBT7088395.1 DNA topoisomerase 3 [bacterium]
MKKLILAEKPSVARDIARVMGATNKHEGYIEGNGYIVTWAVGHLVRLVDPDKYDKKLKYWGLKYLPIIPEEFKLETQANTNIKKQYQVIKKLFNDKETEEIICATDAGREGELIFRYIYSLAKCKKPIKRLWISSQTDEAIKEGFAHLKEEKEMYSLYESAMSRSESDWLIGINATRAYTSRFSKGSGVLSVGRVQTPVLKMIVDRYKEHTEFVPKKYYEIYADIEHAKGDYTGLFLKDKETKFFDQKEAQALTDEIKKIENGIIAKVTKKLRRENPPLLYDLTDLQKDANKRFGYSANSTLKIMQSLYERHKLLTYPRTSSRFLTSDLKPKVAALLKNIGGLDQYKEFTNELLADKLKLTVRMFNDKKVTDHHAIIPTNEKPRLENLSTEELKIYDLVIKRFVAGFMPECEKELTEIITNFEAHTFKTNGTIIKASGWRKVYMSKDNNNDEKENLLPDVAKDDAVKQKDLRMEEKETTPPPLFTEASILGAMETAGKSIEDEELKEAMRDCGLGTPATRAQILERLITVKYIERAKKNLIPTQKGIQLTDLIKDKALLSPELTGEWEKKLNDIYLHKYTREKFMTEIKEFTKNIIDKVNDSTEEAIKTFGIKIATCPLCGGDISENRKAYGCSNWKEKSCKFVIWKIVASRKVTPDEAIKLINTGETGFLRGFKSRAGKNFEANLKFNDDHKVEMEFKPFKKKEE